jgi:hypothetical protein
VATALAITIFVIFVDAAPSVGSAAGGGGGGAYYYSSINGRVTNRQVVPARFHDVMTGLRVCASMP